jgi:hypothetical protein
MYDIIRPHTIGESKMLGSTLLIRSATVATFRDMPQWKSLWLRI